MSTAAVLKLNCISLSSWLSASLLLMQKPVLQCIGPVAHSYNT